MRQRAALNSGEIHAILSGFSIALFWLSSKIDAPLGSLAAYSLLERGSVFCLEMAADKNMLHNNYSMEHISKAMEPWAY